MAKEPGFSTERERESKVGQVVAEISSVREARRSTSPALTTTVPEKPLFSPL